MITAPFEGCDKTVALVSFANVQIMKKKKKREIEIRLRYSSGPSIFHHNGRCYMHEYKLDEARHGWRTYLTAHGKILPHLSHIAITGRQSREFI